KVIYTLNIRFKSQISMIEIQTCVDNRNTNARARPNQHARGRIDTLNSGRHYLGRGRSRRSHHLKGIGVAGRTCRIEGTNTIRMRALSLKSGVVEAGDIRECLSDLNEARIETTGCREVASFELESILVGRIIGPVEIDLAAGDNQ